VLAFDTQNRWIIDLQTVPSSDVVNDGLGSLRPNGGTNVSTTLQEAAKQLRESNASLKHIIFFSDGFTVPGALNDLEDEAAELLEEGITVSVIATGEGAAEDLRPIAEAGGGRFYPGRDLDRIPEIIVEEALLASRDYIVEGEFFPQITSNDQAVQGLTASPPLFGYIASSTKPTASTLLRIGPDADPLLASWQVGLGTATSWTSDASDRWAQSWADWDGYVQFWNTVIRDTFPSPSGDVETRAQVQGDTLTIEIDSADVFADGTQALARVTTPSGESIEVPLDRISPNTFGAELPADEQGVYAVGTLLQDAAGEPTVSGTALTARSYSAEYQPGEPDERVLERVAAATGGRVDVAASGAFDSENLTPGVSRFSLVPLLLLAAALLWPLAVGLSRIALRGRDAVFAREEQAADRNAALQVHRRTQTSNDGATPGASTRADAASTDADGANGVDEATSRPAATAAAPRPEEPAVPSPLPTPSPLPKATPRPAEPAGDGGSTSTLDALLARKRRNDEDAS